MRLSREGSRGCGLLGALCLGLSACAVPATMQHEWPVVEHRTYAASVDDVWQAVLDVPDGWDTVTRNDRDRIVTMATKLTKDVKRAYKPGMEKGTLVTTLWAVSQGDSSAVLVTARVLSPPGGERVNPTSGYPEKVLLDSIDTRLGRPAHE